MARRVTLRDKWVVGGEGTVRDLFVVPPLVKVSLDAIGHLIHPRKHYLLKKVIILTTVFLYTLIHTDLLAAFLTTALAALLLALLTLAFRTLTKAARDQAFTHLYPNEPTTPLDQSGDPRSALRLKLHVLIGGDSGSGKSNAVWNIIKSLHHYRTPFHLSVIDPAGGVELQDLEHAPYTRAYVDRPHQADDLISEFRDRMNTRLALLKRLGIREFDDQHPQLAPHETWEYLVVDELLLCVAQIKQGPLSPLGEILSVGRKAGFLVIACTQLGQKSTLGDLRDLFPQRVCFRTSTREMAEAILGSATAQQAPAHELRKVGDGYLYTTKARGFFKFHTHHITQAEIDTLTQPHEPQGPPLTHQTTTATTTLPVPTPQGEKPVPYLDRKTGQEKKTATIYRLYSHDDPPVLLYVGRGFQRPAHFPWYQDVDASRTTITYYDTEAEADEQRRQIILAEDPLWNVIEG
jgi:hypothetical protein